MAYARNVLFKPSEYFLDDQIDTSHMNYQREPFGVPTAPLEFASLPPTLDHLLEFAPTSHSIQYDQTSNVWRNMRSPWELYPLQTLGITMNILVPKATLIGSDERRSENGNNVGEENNNNRTIRRNTTNGATEKQTKKTTKKSILRSSKYKPRPPSQKFVTNQQQRRPR